MTDTVFTKVDYNLGALMDSIQMGTIGLPDIQRPFVWKNAKVRNLFDSMYRGFPVGYLLFWENANIDGRKAIGAAVDRSMVLHDCVNRPLYEFARVENGVRSCAFTRP